MNINRQNKRKYKKLLVDWLICVWFRRKTAAGNQGAAAAGTTMAEAELQAPEYKKLYKALGMNSGCKDVRQVV